MSWADYLALVFAILMILNVLIQRSKDGIQNAFSGETSDLFQTKKSKGLEKVLHITMFIWSSLFVIFVIVSRVLLHS